MNRFIPACVSNICVSPSTAATQRARDLKAAGRDIVDMTAGEPDFDTPENVRADGKAAIDRNEAHYTPVNGTPRLREAIRDDFKRRLGLDYASDEICVGGGPSRSCFSRSWPMSTGPPRAGSISMFIPISSLGPA